MKRPLRVLIVEDSESDAALLLRELRRGDYALSFQRVDTPEAMAAALTAQTWDLVVSDYSMPRFSAKAALTMVRQAELDLPFLIVSGTVGEETAVEAMRAGAHDFMAKNALTRLLPAIERGLRDAGTRAESKAVQQQLLHALKMDAIGKLTGGIAHDFNNVLGVIVGNVEVLIESLRSNPIQTELATAILNAALRGAELTKRLLTFARQEPLNPRVIDLNAILPSTVAMLQRTLGESIHISTTLANGLWLSQADPSRVEDALINLAINARDAMPQGGTLAIATANVELDEHYAALHPGVLAGEYVVLSVTDTGTGMPPDVVARATEPFFTTKQQGKGTGLGLSMIYSFARQCNGHLKIYSEVGTGTTVKLYLPKAGKREQHATADPSPLPAETVPRNGETILLVDDNADLRMVAEVQLREMGYEVCTAEHGPAALALFEAGQRFDLLFTDIGMPEGMNGYELAAAARQLQPGLKVLFTTGYASVGAAPGQEAQDLPPGAMLRKPYRKQDLARMIRTVLDTPGPA
ncbi:MAG: response regulator [Nevskia sp.]|nr:response regulator [Nevskia sp.]